MVEKPGDFHFKENGAEVEGGANGDIIQDVWSRSNWNRMIDQITAITTYVNECKGHTTYRIVDGQRKNIDYDVKESHTPRITGNLPIMPDESVTHITAKMFNDVMQFLAPNLKKTYTEMESEMLITAQMANDLENMVNELNAITPVCDGKDIQI